MDESSLAQRYPDYFPSPNDPLPPPLHNTSPCPPPSLPPSVPSFTPYTLSDFRTLPREVRLTSLGSSVDPAHVDAYRRKRREMREMERQVREENARRLAAVKRGGAVMGVEGGVREVRVSARERAKVFAASVPKPKAAPPSPVQVERLVVSREEEKGKRKGTQGRTPSVADRRKVDPAAAPPAAGAADANSLDALLARQEEERRAVQQIRQALRL